LRIRFRIRYSVIIWSLLYRSCRDVDCESQSALIENSFYVTPVPVMIRLIPISGSLRNEFLFDVACARLFICVTHACARGARGLNMYAYVCVCVCIGATGLSRRLIYRRVRYRTPRATICRCVVLLLIEMWSWTTTIERSFARSRSASLRAEITGTFHYRTSPT